MSGPRDTVAQDGFVTIEVIVAFVILAFGLMLALQALALASRSIVAADRLRSETLELKRSALSQEVGSIEPAAGFRP